PRLRVPRVPRCLGLQPPGLRIPRWGGGCGSGHLRSLEDVPLEERDRHLAELQRNPTRVKAEACSSLCGTPGSGGGAEPTTLESRAAGSDRKSTRLNSSHQIISYAVFCLKKKN